MPSPNLHPRPGRSQGYPTTPNTNAYSASVAPYDDDDGTCNHSYSAFMATLAGVNPNDEPHEFQQIISQILRVYPGQSASQVRASFVADFFKFRKVNKIFKTTLTDKEHHLANKLKNMFRCDSRKHQLPEVQAALRKLCNGNTLPDGTEIGTICLESCKMLVRILEDANKRKLCVKSLWEEFFENKKYTTREMARIRERYFASQGDRHNDDEREDDSKGDISADRDNSEADGQSDGFADDDGAYLGTMAIADTNTAGSDSAHGRGVPQPHSSSPLLPSFNCLEPLGSDCTLFKAFGQDADSIEWKYANKNPDNNNNDNVIDDHTESDISVSSVVLTKRKLHKSELTSAAKRSCSRIKKKNDVDINIRRLTSNHCLNDEDLMGLLRLMAALCPLSVYVFDPLFTDGSTTNLPERVQNDLPRTTDDIILAPLHLAQAHHWVLAIALPNKVYIMDSLPFEPHQAELIAKVRLLQALLPGEQPAMSDKDGSFERLVEHVDCTRQTNYVDCGVAVIVNAIRVISGTEAYNEPTEFDVWRQVLAVLLKPGCCTSLVEKQRFAALFETLPIPPVGPQPRAHTELMSASDCKLWCQSTMAYVKRLHVAIKDQTRPAEEARIKALGVLKDIGELLTQVSQAGTGDWRPGFSLKSANSRRDSFSPSQSEIDEALWYYNCAKRAFRDSRFSDRNRDFHLNRGVKHLQKLSRLRSETVNRLNRVMDMINADVQWLHQLHDPQYMEDFDSDIS